MSDEYSRQIMTRSTLRLFGDRRTRRARQLTEPKAWLLTHLWFPVASPTHRHERRKGARRAGAAIPETEEKQ